MKQIRFLIMFFCFLYQCWIDAEIRKISYSDLLDKDKLQELKSINELELDLSMIYIPDLELIRELTNLTYLSLALNRIENIEPLKDLTNLTELDLSGNQITDLEPLKELKKLEYLWFSGNPLQKSKIEELKKTLPKTDIRF